MAEQAAPRWPLHPVLVYALLFTALFALHAPLLRLPYFWDEAGYYVPAAHDLYLHGSLIPQDTVSNAHPPLVMAWLAGWWKLSGFKPAVTRTAMLLVAAFALLGLYRLALIVSNARVAGATVACTAVYSVFYTQSSLAHVDVAAAAFTFWMLSFYAQRRIALSAGMACFAVLCKETALIGPLTLVVWEMFCWGMGKRRLAAGREPAPWCVSPERFHHAFWQALPVVPLGLWFAYHYARVGYVFGNPEFVRYNVTATLSPLRFVLALGQRAWQLLGHMNLFALTAAALVALWLPAQPGRERIAWRQQATFLVMAGAYVVALSLIGGALLTRYLLPVIPLVILVCVATLWRRVRGWGVAIAAVAAMFVVSWFVAPPYRFAPEDNLAYRDYVVLHARAAAFLAKRFPGARVLTAWPASDELARPYLGYVKEPIPVVRLENFTLEQIALAQHTREPYDVALLFSTKYETPRRLRWEAWERQQRRFFDFHEDVAPEVAARMLGGEIVFEERRGGEWVAVVDMRRAQNAALR